MDTLVLTVLNMQALQAATASSRRVSSHIVILAASVTHRCIEILVFHLRQDLSLVPFRRSHVMMVLDLEQ